MTLRTRWRKGDDFLVLHKDKDLVVVDKKAGVLTVGRPSGRGRDLVRGVQEMLGPRSSVIAVHRLDRPVSGVLVLARSGAAEQGLIRQFARHTVERRYVAAVQGSLQKDAGTFVSELASAGRELRMRSTEGGRQAVTHYRVVERLTEATIVEVSLETGLRNQIRVHFSEAGHPLLGERKYLDDEDPDASSSQGTARLFLHAEVLGFEHPITGRPMRFQAPVPPDLKAWYRRLSAR